LSTSVKLISCGYFVHLCNFLIQIENYDSITTNFYFHYLILYLNLGVFQYFIIEFYVFHSFMFFLRILYCHLQKFLLLYIFNFDFLFLIIFVDHFRTKYYLNINFYFSMIFYSKTYCLFIIFYI
jgi:hypothetical protein